MVLKQETGGRERDRLEAAHRVVGIGEVVPRRAGYIHAGQSAVAIVGGIMDVVRAQPGHNLLIEGKMAGSIVLPGNIGDHVLSQGSSSILRFRQPAGVIVKELGPLGGVVPSHLGLTV